MDPLISSKINIPAKIKQPEPSVGAEVKAEETSKEETSKPKKKKREIIRPNVGVVDAPKISTTPMRDTITLKKRENPHTVYKKTPKSKKNFHFQGVMSGVIGVCGVASLISLIKSIRS